MAGAVVAVSNDCPVTLPRRHGEAGGALDVVEGFGTGHLLPLKYLVRAECPFELAHKFFNVFLHDTVQRHQLTVDIVEHFYRSILGPHEIQRGTAGKYLDVAFVCRKRNDAVCNVKNQGPELIEPGQSSEYIQNTSATAQTQPRVSRNDSPAIRLSIKVPSPFQKCR